MSYVKKTVKGKATKLFKAVKGKATKFVVKVRPLLVSDPQSNVDAPTSSSCDPARLRSECPKSDPVLNLP